MGCPHCPLACFICGSQPYEWTFVARPPFCLQIGSHLQRKLGLAILPCLPSHLEYFWGWCRLRFVSTDSWAFQWESEKAETLPDAFTYVNEFLGNFSLLFYTMSVRSSYENFQCVVEWFLQLSLKVALQFPHICGLSNINKSKVCWSFKFWQSITRNIAIKNFHKGTQLVNLYLFSRENSKWWSYGPNKLFTLFLK